MSSKIDYDTPVTTLTGQEQTLSAYAGKVLLIVNTASKCGLTPQYEGLEKLHAKYRDQGLVVLGFPSNQFGSQEPGSADEISQFCEINYGVTFPMFAKIDVNGANTHPLFATLKKEAKGLLGTKDIKWNFTKFLVARDGTILDRYAPTTKPEDLESDIVSALSKQA